jgi:hypothetical protein
MATRQGAAADFGEGRRTGLDWLGRLLVGWRLGFEDARAGGEDSIQGHAEAIRRASTAGRGGHGWRRPWGRRLRRPCRARHGGDRQRKGKRAREEADRLGPTRKWLRGVW